MRHLCRGTGSIGENTGPADTDHGTARLGTGNGAGTFQDNEDDMTIVEDEKA